MRIAWFSPFPPIRSGIAAYSAELIPVLTAAHAIDPYPESAAGDFVWRHRLRPYDLIVYQLGNAPCHDYMWAYLARFPGLVVLHDARLHQARARHLLQQRRPGDYRREFLYDHPDAQPAFADYAAAGLGGPIYYCWSMLRVVMNTARLVAVHSPCVAADLRADYPDVDVETIHMGVAADAVRSAPAAARAAIRADIRRRWNLPADAVVFAAFGKVTAEKRVDAMLRALAALVVEGRAAYLLLVGDAGEYATLDRELAAHGVAERVRVTGHVPDDEIGAHLAAADVCLCLRWPTALETSASWLRCLAAGRATVITDLAHLADIPDDVVLRVALLDEDRSLASAMRALADDEPRRDRIGAAGHAFWAEQHTLARMAADYRRVLATAASRRAPTPRDLPAHFRDDHGNASRTILGRFGVDAAALFNS